MWEGVTKLLCQQCLCVYLHCIFFYETATKDTMCALLIHVEEGLDIWGLQYSKEGFQIQRNPAHRPPHLLGKGCRDKALIPLTRGEHIITIPSFHGQPDNTSRWVSGMELGGGGCHFIFLSFLYFLSLGNPYTTLLDTY